MSESNSLEFYLSANESRTDSVLIPIIIEDIVFVNEAMRLIKRNNIIFDNKFLKNNFKKLTKHRIVFFTLVPMLPFQE